MRVAPYLILLSATVGLAAQGPAAENQTDRSFQTDVNYVRVDMYPTADGRPVTDLQQSEIDVLEDGKPQAIAQFERVFISGPRVQTALPEPSSVGDMRRAAQDPHARVVVLFLDPRHVDRDGSMKIRKPLVDALNTLIGGDDLIAVMTPEMSVHGLTFARRPDRIESLLERYWGEETWPGSKDPAEFKWESCYDTPMISERDARTGQVIDGPAITREMIARHREVQVLDAVRDLVGYLGELRDERKAVIAITDGWALYKPNRTLAKQIVAPKIDDQTPTPPPAWPVPIPTLISDPHTGKPTFNPDPNTTTVSNDGVGSVDRMGCEADRTALSEIDDEPRLIRLMQSANRANVSFYPVAPGRFGAMYTPVNARDRSLRMLADITDGRAVLQPQDLDAGLRRVVEDLKLGTTCLATTRTRSPTAGSTASPCA